MRGIKRDRRNTQKTKLVHARALPDAFCEIFTSHPFRDKLGRGGSGTEDDFPVV